MPDSYLDFLDQKAAQRRLLAKFAQPRLLLLHTIAFVGVVTGLWWVIMPLLRWVPLTLFNLPALAFFAWSIVLAAHALLHYRRSSARTEARELVVEAEMRQLIEQHSGDLNDDALFAMHANLAGQLERHGWLSQGLTVFALVNAVSWFGASLNLGTNWGYFLTLPTALILVGGVYGFRAWQHSRKTGGGGIFARLPLRHLIVYALGVVLLAVSVSARMVNPWDADALVGIWTLAVLLHVVWSLLAPVFSRASLEHQAQAGKRKQAPRLALADDGELISESDLNAADSRSVRSALRR